MIVACPSNYSLEPLIENATTYITCLPLSSYWHNEIFLATANAIGESLHHKTSWFLNHFLHPPFTLPHTVQFPEFHSMLLHPQPSVALQK
jgi:hypothetical protein